MDPLLVLEWLGVIAAGGCVALIILVVIGLALSIVLWWRDR